MKKELFGELRVIGMKGCEDFAEQVDFYLLHPKKEVCLMLLVVSLS